MKRILLLTVLAHCLCSSTFFAQTNSTASNTTRKWWKEAVVYQLYPRSFKDSNGDGVGDLKGIISKLDYLKSLGIDVVWLNPIYSSPNDDNGYDVSDYRDITKEVGTMADFDALLKGLHDRGMKLVMDLVVNHSSDEHEWFKGSRSSRTNPYRNYYHWWNAEDGKPPYRYSLFDVARDAWKYDSLTNAYYLHYFSRKQPDLNWENPKLRQEVYGAMKFWADKGIDGFRLDAFGFAAKDTTWPQFPKGFEQNFIRYYSMQGNLHGYLQEMAKEVLSKYDVMSVAEGAGNSFEDAHNLVDEDRHELNMAYAFDAVDIAKPEGWSLLRLKEIFTRWDSAFADKGWLSIFLSNHDQARLVSRYGNDAPAFRELSAKMLATFLLTMRGTPYVYYGDELGMSNPGFTKSTDYRDKQFFSEYSYEKSRGTDTAVFLKRMRFSHRDNGRTPFQWDATTAAGFSTGTPWITVNKNYTTVNAEAEEKDPSSVLNHFRKAVKLRKDNDVLVYGKYTLLDKSNQKVYAYTREEAGKKMLVVLNFSSSPAMASIGFDLVNAKPLLWNYKDLATGSKGKTSVALRPYEAIVYSVQ